MDDNLLNILRIVLRLIHIASAVAWVGIGLTLATFILPAGNTTGTWHFPFERALLNRTRLPSTFPVVALLTTAAGLLLYATGSHNVFTTTGNIVLGIGALFGLLAFGHGFGVGRYTSAYSKALAATGIEDEPVAANQLENLRQLRAKLYTNSRISLGLTIVALLGMGLARYL